MKVKRPARARQENGESHGKEERGNAGNRETIMKHWRKSAGFLFGACLLLIISEGIFKEPLLMSLSVSFLIVALIFGFSYGMTDLIHRMIKKVKSGKQIIKIRWPGNKNAA